MSQLAVLVIGPCEQGLLSAQLILREGNTQLECGHTYSEAEHFLLEHPGALMMCERSLQDSRRRESVSRLISEGKPSAFLLIAEQDANRLLVEVRLFGDENILGVIFNDLSVMRRIHLAWECCKATRTESAATGEPIVARWIM